MNRHTKVALMVAPFLILGGYIAAEFYLDYQAKQERIYVMKPLGHCDVINQKCVLESGEFQINVSDKDGVTEINSTFPLDTATLFLVDSTDKATPYPLGMQQSPYYWQSPTELRALAPNPGDSYKLRIIATIKGGRYLGEFYTQAIGPE
ncbi:hypothetical protein DBZ36_18505 [Alginatibacterium sediminis]|uniref:Uncharacterized protein n=1 Tax=Alginatibacterium sediminis TaxID=2164068 RepID=A0A420E7S3_9ALTE|nr:hypothetical protein [Alginatibacterium sediminis]RKF13762.1 hypothetical protein DBZ36_18505 [Alginatibacterium sediminis]